MPSCLLHPSLDSDQVDRFFFMLHCLSRGVPFSHSPPLPTDVFQCEGHLFVFPLLWGLMDGLCCCTSHKGGGGVVQFIGWLPKVKAPDTSGTQPPFSDSAVNKIVFKIRY